MGRQPQIHAKMVYNRHGEGTFVFSASLTLALQDLSQHRSKACVNCSIIGMGPWPHEPAAAMPACQSSASPMSGRQSQIPNSDQGECFIQGGQSCQLDLDGDTAGPDRPAWDPGSRLSIGQRCLLQKHGGRMPTDCGIITGATGRQHPAPPMHCRQVRLCSQVEEHQRALSQH